MVTIDPPKIATHNLDNRLLH